MRAFPAILLSVTLLAGPSASAAKISWEDCLDKGDFAYDDGEGTLLGFASALNVEKKGCVFTFSSIEGKGEKLVVNVCNPGIGIDHYATLDSSPKRVYAGVGGCPAPGFGADFSENAKELSEYKELRKHAFEVFEKVKKYYETHNEARGPVTQFDQNDSASRLWCGNFLLSEYLKRCLSFEGRKGEAPATKESGGNLLEGIHPQTIKK